MKKPVIKKKKLTKLQKEKLLEHEIDEFINHVSSGNLETLIEKVGWILNHHPKTRDSDITCQLVFWKTFEPDIFHNGLIKPDDLYKFTKLTAIARTRAKIQNEYKLFLASVEVQKHRGKLEEEYESWAVSEQPDCPQYSVYVDESGKTGNNIILGSVWILDSISTMKLFNEIISLKESNHFNKEFHFKNLNNGSETIYMKLIDLLYQYSTALSFKFKYISKDGVNVQNALNTLFYHLLVDGINHECSTGRAPLPRSLQVIKDLESKGADTIQLKELKSRMQVTSKSLFDNKLYLNEFRAIDSKDNFYLQIADIYVASLNRKLNEQPNNNAKDRVSEYLFKKFKITFDDNRIESLSDISSGSEL